MRGMISNTLFTQRLYFVQANEQVDYKIKQKYRQWDSAQYIHTQNQYNTFRFYKYPVA